MKIILLGNAGAGKTTLSRALMEDHQVSRLSLDAVAFSQGSERSPLTESVQRVLDFIESHDGWIVEGCYADIIESFLNHCDMLVFLNPNVATCIEHCRRRPWEPEKFASRSEQEQNLDNLIQWVSEYETRTDEYGLQQHRRLFDSFPGRKMELTQLLPDAARKIIAAYQ